MCRHALYLLSSTLPTLSTPFNVAQRHSVPNSIHLKAAAGDHVSEREPCDVTDEIFCIVFPPLLISFCWHHEKWVKRWSVSSCWWEGSVFFYSLRQRLMVFCICQCQSKGMAWFSSVNEYYIQYVPHFELAHQLNTVFGHITFFFLKIDSLCNF